MLKNLRHSTDWGVLQSILSKGLVEPQTIAAQDLSNQILGALANLGLPCAWFTSQAWTNNRFGPYTLVIPVSGVVLDRLVDLGRHNGARCYLSAPSPLADWIAQKLQCGTILSSPGQWEPASADDRVDILATWPVPISDAIEFVTANTRSAWPLDNANFAEARFTAKMLLQRESRYNEALRDFSDADRAGNLLRWLHGDSAARFDKARAATEGLGSDTAPNVLTEALSKLVRGDVVGAVSEAARIGTSQDVATVLAPVINAHFGIHLTAQEIAAAM